MNRIDQIRELLSGISSESLADVLRERGYEVRISPEHNTVTMRIIPASDVIEAMSGIDTTAARTAVKGNS